MDVVLGWTCQNPTDTFIYLFNIACSMVRRNGAFFKYMICWHECSLRSFRNSFQDEYFFYHIIQLNKSPAGFLFTKQGITSDGQLHQEQSRLSRKRIRKSYFSLLLDNLFHTHAVSIFMRSITLYLKEILLDFISDKNRLCWAKKTLFTKLKPCGAILCVSSQK